MTIQWPSRVGHLKESKPVLSGGFSVVAGCSTAPPAARAECGTTEVYLQISEELTMANNSMSGLTDQEAQEFHGIFLQSMYAFFGIVVIAHILAWLWRPWL